MNTNHAPLKNSMIPNTGSEYEQVIAACSMASNYS